MKQKNYSFAVFEHQYDDLFVEHLFEQEKDMLVFVRETQGIENFRTVGFRGFIRNGSLQTIRKHQGEIPRIFH